MPLTEVENPCVFFNSDNYLEDVCTRLILESHSWKGQTNWLTKGKCRHATFRFCVCVSFVSKVSCWYNEERCSFDKVELSVHLECQQNLIFSCRLTKQFWLVRFPSLYSFTKLPLAWVAKLICCVYWEEMCSRPAPSLCRQRTLSEHTAETNDLPLAVIS